MNSRRPERRTGLRFVFTASGVGLLLVSSLGVGAWRDATRAQRASTPAASGSPGGTRDHAEPAGTTLQSAREALARPEGSGDDDHRVVPRWTGAQQCAPAPDAWREGAPWFAHWSHALADPPDAGKTDTPFVIGPYLQSVRRTSVTVVWETSAPASCELVYGLQGGARSSQAANPSCTRHVVTLASLEPARRYEYEVRCGNARSESGTFTTEANAAERLRVAVFGDTRTNHDIHRAVVERLAAAAPQLAFHTGDLVNDDRFEEEWINFFRVESALVRNTALYPVIGNHEGAARGYLRHFELPGDTPSPERYYAVRYAGVLFLVLDQYDGSLDVGGAQAGWMEEKLAEASRDGLRHIVALMHHGPYDSGAHGPNLEARRNLVPLFEHYGVDMVFSGHDHDYERSTVRGVSYVVTGGGGAPLRPVKGDWHTQVSASEYHYGLLEVHGPVMKFTAYRLDGSVLDTVQLREGGGECAAGSACEGPAPRSCEPKELGTWACVEGACIWDCRRGPPCTPGVVP